MSLVLQFTRVIFFVLIITIDFFYLRATHYIARNRKTCMRKLILRYGLKQFFLPAGKYNACI